MTIRMLVDAAHSEELRVAVVNDNKVEEFEVETAGKEQVKGNIYAGEITRVEPSLQAAFISYGGNRNGFLAFSEIHPQWFDLPKKEKEELIKELEEIAARRRGGNSKSDEDDSLAVDDPSDADHEHDDDEEDIHVDVKAEADEKTDDKKGKKPSRGRKKAKKADDEKADMDIEDAMEAKVEEMADGAPNTDNVDDGLTDEEREEDARALAIANSMVTNVDEAPEPKKRGRKPTRHNKKGKEEAKEDKKPSRKKAAKESTAEDEKAKPSEEEETGKRQPPIHRRYAIQDVVKEGTKIMVQVNKEERGTKGAALTTYISLPGRFTVLMPNTPYAGGISRKITDFSDRKELKKAVEALKIPDGMGLIVRTAGVGQPAENIERDFKNLCAHWDKLEKEFKKNNAPCCVHEDGSLAVRAARDIFSDEVEEIIVSGRRVYSTIKEYMKSLMPESAKKVKEYRGSTPLFTQHGVEKELNKLHTTRVQLESGGYLVINSTEALVAIDVNSGRATQEKNIEETALKTNLEAADEVCRQLRLRDLAGLVIIDFIDMEDRRNERAIERAMKKAIRRDRARIQISGISDFGLMEMSRQRLRPSLNESTFVACSHCNGTGMVSSLASSALMILRSLEEDSVAGKADRVIITTSADLAVYILNQKRELIRDMEARYKFHVLIRADDKYIGPDHKLELVRVESSGNEKTVTQEVVLREPPEAGPEARTRRRRRGGRKKGPQETTNTRGGRRSNTRGRRNARDDQYDGSEKDVKESVEASSKEKDEKPKRTRGGRRPRRASETKTSDVKKEVATSAEHDKPAFEDKKSARSDAKKEDKSGDADAPAKKGVKTARKKRDTSDKPSKGVSVQRIGADGTTDVEKSDVTSSSGGVFQRWWSKS